MLTIKSLKSARLGVLVLVLSMNGIAHAGDALNAPSDRISDEAIHADHQTYKAVQARIKSLNDSGQHRVASYHLAKAQCWLDVSFHEYTRNDRSSFPQEAMDQSVLLIHAMEAGKTAQQIGYDTPLVNHAARLREDLWQSLAQLRGSEGFACAERQIACAEVELVHAGNEQNQQGWRHAKPYVQMAEDASAEAKQLVESCAAPKVPAPAPALLPVAPLPSKPQSLKLQTHVWFNFDKRDAANMRPNTVSELSGRLAEIQAGGWKIIKVSAVGHADRLNGTRQTSYNVKLAADRADTVRQYLERHGVAANLIETSANGDSQQVVSCDALLKPVALQECLLPNRRVEVQFELQR